MPNHVNNYLLLEGSQAEIAAFFFKAAGKGANGEDRIFTFNAFVPMPETVLREDLGQREQLEFPGDFNWLDWSIKHWGTQWDCYNVSVDSPRVQFQTAWSVPRPVLMEISKQFPGLTLTNEYIEAMLESAGRIVLKAGSILFDEHETFKAWNEKASRYIHSLNRKYNNDHYVSYLEECAEDEPEDSMYVQYLQVCKLEDVMSN